MRTLIIAAIVLIAAGAGLGGGYLMWGQPTNWYAADITKLGQGVENDLVRYGRELIVDTPRHIGKNATVRPCVSPATTSPARIAI